MLNNQVIMEDSESTYDIDMQKSIEDINRDMLKNRNKKNTLLIIMSILASIIITIVKYGIDRKTLIGVSWLVVAGIIINLGNIVIKDDEKRAIQIFLMGGIAANVHSLLIGGSVNTFTVTFVCLGMSAMYFNDKILIYSSVPLCIFMLGLSIVAPYAIEGKGGTVAEAIAKVVIYGVSVVLMRQAIGVGERNSLISYEGLVQLRNSRKMSNELAEELNSIVNESTKSVMELVQQANSIDDVSKDITDEIVKSNGCIDRINKSVSDVQGYINKNAELSQELNNKYKDVIDVVNNGIDKVENTKSILNNMGQKITESSNISSDLTKNMEEVVDIIEEIDNIFSQTKLLALNASIEAARAGENGKGFEVVAGEIRSLATQSAKASENVKQITSTLNNTIHDVMLKIKDGSKVSEDGYRALDSITDILRRITYKSSNVEEIINNEEILIQSILVEFSKIIEEIMNVEALSKDNTDMLENIQKNIGKQNVSVQELGKKMEAVGKLAVDVK